MCVRDYAGKVLMFGFENQNGANPPFKGGKGDYFKVKK